jgi:ribosomal protein S4E
LAYNRRAAGGSNDKTWSIASREKPPMKTDSAKSLRAVKDGARCNVVGGTHAGKSGVVRDINTSKTGHVTITVVQKSGERFKTLARNVEIAK